MENEKDLTPGCIPIESTIPINPIIQVDAQALITQAIEKESPIEVMERLLAMRRELKEEMARDAYFHDMANFQRDCPVIEKNVPVYDKSGRLRYKYATLDDIVKQVKKHLVDNGFSYIIKTKHTNEAVTAHCNIRHRQGHEEIDKDGVTIPIDEKAYMNVAQKVASALTFAKRYAFCNAFGIITGDGDDDGNYTGKPEQKSMQKESGVTFANAPEENKNIYGTIMHLLREKYENQDLFTRQEREENKKKADAVLGYIEALKALYSGINKVAQDKRRTLNKGNKNA